MKSLRKSQILIVADPKVGEITTAMSKRVFVQLPRPLKNLADVKTVFKHFEQYGRLLEFNIHRDLFTRERDQLLWITYVDDTCANQALKKMNVNIRLSEPSKAETSEESTNSDSRGRSPNRSHEIYVKVGLGTTTLADSIAARASKELRVNDTVQSRVNRRMLRGFEGFNGELTRLWNQAGVESREKTVSHMVKDKLKNDKRESSRQKMRERIGKQEGQGDAGMSQEEIAPSTAGLLAATIKDISLDVLSARLGEVEGVVGDLRSDFLPESVKNFAEVRVETVTVDAVPVQPRAGQPEEQQGTMEGTGEPVSDLVNSTTAADSSTDISTDSSGTKTETVV